MGYFLRIPNVGDRANPNVIEVLTKQPVKWTGDYTLPHLLASGSIMASAAPRSIVWGTGVMHPALFGHGGVDGRNIYALRGPLTLATLREAGVPVGDVPLGDPGFLAPALMNVHRTQPAFRYGLVAHYVDRAHPQIRALLLDPDVADLDVHADPLTFLRHMAACEMVLSTSLHGLVFAEALGIPNVWLKASDLIAGEDFKFHDWFATTARPQKAAVQLSGGEKPSELALHAELHESLIDVTALKAAFPHHRIDEISTQIGQGFVPVTQAREQPMPAFLISYNRPEMLRAAMDGLGRISRLTQVVVHDNGSNDPNAAALLDELALAGVRIVRRSPIRVADDLNLVDETVAEFFADWGEPQRYIVSDCDIDLGVAAPETLDVYDELLNRYREIQSVGPMLRIRDIPLSYPLFNRAVNRHIEQFWRHTPTLTDSRFGQVAFLEHVIDTTLAMHRAGEPFQRLKTALRVYEPYEARHLDWYRTAAQDDHYTRSSNPEISHWNNAIERERHKDIPLEWDSFNAVRARQDRSIEIYTVHIRENWPSIDSA